MNNQHNIDISFILSCWFDQISQQNRMLSYTIEQTHNHLRVIDRNLANQRQNTLALMERLIPNLSNSTRTPNIIDPPIFNFNNSNTNRRNTTSTRNNNFRSQPVWRFPPPPPPQPRWPTPSSARRRRNARISNLIHESINSMNAATNRISGFRNTPTSLQIHDATTTCKWKDIKSSTDQEICPITQQNFEDGDDVLKINHCGHIFKKDSLVTWFERSSLCPVCRHDITIDPSNNISSALNQFVTSLNRDISSNNFVVDVSFDLIHGSPRIHSPLTTETSTNTDISHNAFPSIP